MPPEALAGTIQNDILKEFLVRNTYIYPPRASMRIVSDIFAYASENMPKFNPISISGYHMQEAGATADLELAYTLADGLEYVRAGVAAGLPIDSVRAAPLLLLRHRHAFLHGGGEAPRRPPPLGGADRGEIPARRPALADAAHALPDLRLVAHGAGRLQQRRAHDDRGDGGDAGGTQSLHTNALDEALALPTDFSARIARNTQLVLALESGTTRDHRSVGRLLLCRAADRRPCRSAPARHIAEVEALGGMARAIETGLPQIRIEESAARTQAQIDSGEQIVVGVNRYRSSDAADDRGAEGRQRGRPRRADRQARAAAGRARQQRGRGRASALSEAARGQR